MQDNSNDLAAFVAERIEAEMMAALIGLDVASRAEARLVAEVADAKVRTAKVRLA